MKEGTKVRIIQDVDFFPHFILRAGSEGIVDEVDPGHVVWISFPWHAIGMTPRPWDEFLAHPKEPERCLVCFTDDRYAALPELCEVVSE